VRASVFLDYGLIFVRLTFFFLSCIGCVFIYITTAAPSARSLGATNGLSQTTVSIARAAARITAAWLFAFSAEHNVLGGYAVYAVLVVLPVFCLLAAAPLPENGWDEAGGKTSGT
jgi:hypothetical protein